MASVGTWANGRRFAQPLCPQIEFNPTGKPDFDSLERCLCVGHGAPPPSATSCSCFENNTAPEQVSVRIPALVGNANPCGALGFCEPLSGSWVLDSYSVDGICHGWRGMGPFDPEDPLWEDFALENGAISLLVFPSCLVFLSLHITATSANDVAWDFLPTEVPAPFPTDFSWPGLLRYDPFLGNCCGDVTPGPASASAVL